MKNTYSKYLKSSSAFILMLSIAGAGIAQENSQIQIFSPNANPSNPITIESEVPASGPIQIQQSQGQQVVLPAQQVLDSPAPQQVSPQPVQNQIPQSSFNSVDSLSPDQVEMLGKILDTIENANGPVNQEVLPDPMDGLTPEDRAFSAAIQGIIPMTPEQIRLFKQRYYETKSVTRSSVVGDPIPTSRSIDLSLRPGEMAPTVRLSAGNVSTITFSDITGQPWPILSVTVGDPSSFSAQTAGPQGDTNILVVTPLSDYSRSNSVVTLVGHPVPVLLTLDSREQTEIDYRMDIRLDGKGPKATFDVPMVQNLPPTSDKVIQAFLDGVPPRQAEMKKTSDRGVEAWILEDNMYIRTRGQVLSPAFMAKSTNVSGVSVYVLKETPVLLVSVDGVMRNITVSR